MECIKIIDEEEKPRMGSSTFGGQIEMKMGGGGGSNQVDDHQISYFFVFLEKCCFVLF